MGDIEIRLRFNRKTGKKDIIIGYESESDALPIEHEEEHQAIVFKLLDQGVLAPSELGNVHVERIVAPPPGSRDAESPGAQATEA